MTSMSYDILYPLISLHMKLVVTRYSRSQLSLSLYSPHRQLVIVETCIIRHIFYWLEPDGKGVHKILLFTTVFRT